MQNILIVVDMQNDFIDGTLGTAEASAVTAKASQKIKNHDGPIFITYDTHSDNYLETEEGRKLPVPHCIKGTRGWELNGKISDALIGKRCFAVEKSTFGSLELPEAIRKECGNDSLHIELIGLCTDICVVSNALILKASFPNDTISVDSSCCAGVTPQAHREAVNTMRSCQIDIV